MSAIHEFSESNGVGAVVTDSITNINFGSTDDHDLVPADYTIIAGENSFHKCIRCKFSSTFTEISNMKFWKSLGDFLTGEAIKFICEVAYSQPATTPLTSAVDIPVSEPGSANITPSTISAPGYTDYIKLQEQTTGSTPAGNVNTKTFTFKYDEF